MSWREEYLHVLKEADSRAKKDYELIDAYTTLTDRTAALEAEKAAITSTSTATTTGARLSSQSPSNADGISQLRSDLAEALRSKGQLQSRLKVAEEEIQRSRLKIKSDAKLIKELSTERILLNTKVRDRDEELKGKAKLLEDVQDEMLSLNLQLNMVEQRSKKLQKENKDLIDRWMIRMGEEAEAMNKASKFS
ncbi:MAG: hypothetical protein M1818_007320 [Claussenomyces sp. TS43310]|nr:MAG: hypothetical protein M1818_007320 [Claussenomyces sp. TS43310]